MCHFHNNRRKGNRINMVSKELSEAAVELDVVFEHSTKELLDKIPLNFRNFIKQIKSKSYEFEYDTSKSLNEQHLKNMTRGLIVLVYRDYICDDKFEYLKKFNKVLDNKEEEKRLKYPINVFESFESNEDKNEINFENIQMIERKKNNIFREILNKIKKWIKK